MPAWTEVTVDESVGGEEVLGLPRGFEPLHLTLSSPRRSMRVLGSIGWTVAAVASAQDVTPKTVRKWRDRFAAEGACGVADRTSRPHRSPRRLSKEQQEAIVALRRKRLTGPVIARQLQDPVSTVGLALRRAGLGRLAAA
jgi:hypothetical protein